MRRSPLTGGRSQEIMGPRGVELISDVLAHSVRCARLAEFEPPAVQNPLLTLLAAEFMGPRGFEPLTTRL